MKLYDCKFENILFSVKDENIFMEFPDENIIECENMLDSNSDKVYVRSMSGINGFLKENESVDAIMWVNSPVLSFKALTKILEYSTIRLVFFKIKPELNYRFFNSSVECKLLPEDFFPIFKRECGAELYVTLVNNFYYVSIRKN